MNDEAESLNDIAIELEKTRKVLKYLLKAIDSRVYAEYEQSK